MYKRETAYRLACEHRGAGRDGGAWRRPPAVRRHLPQTTRPCLLVGHCKTCISSSPRRRWRVSALPRRRSPPLPPLAALVETAMTTRCTARWPPSPSRPWHRQRPSSRTWGTAALPWARARPAAVLVVWLSSPRRRRSPPLLSPLRPRTTSCWRRLSSCSPASAALRQVRTNPWCWLTHHAQHQ